MTSKDKAQIVRQLLLSDPTNMGPEYDAFRSALRKEIDNPMGAATVDHLYETLPKQD